MPLPLLQVYMVIAPLLPSPPVSLIPSNAANTSRFYSRPACLYCLILLLRSLTPLSFPTPPDTLRAITPVVLGSPTSIVPCPRQLARFKARGPLLRPIARCFRTLSRTVKPRPKPRPTAVDDSDNEWMATVELGWAASDGRELMPRLVVHSATVKVLVSVCG